MHNVRVISIMQMDLINSWAYVRVCCFSWVALLSVWQGWQWAVGLDGIVWRVSVRRWRWQFNVWRCNAGIQCRTFCACVEYYIFTRVLEHTQRRTFAWLSNCVQDVWQMEYLFRSHIHWTVGGNKWLLAEIMESICVCVCVWMTYSYMYMLISLLVLILYGNIIILLNKISLHLKSMCPILKPITAIEWSWDYCTTIT